MTPATIGIIGTVALVVLLLLRVPVGMSMILVAVVGQAFLINFNAALARLGLDAYSTITNPSLSVIPLFMLMGFALSQARLASDLFTLAATLMGRMRGSLAMATIGGSAMFSAVSGSAVATTLTMAVVSVPEMLKHKYDERLAAGAAAVGGTLGILIPPSGILVLYGLLTEESIGRVLIAGIVPGIMTAVMLIATAYLIARLRPTWAPSVTERRPLREVPGIATLWVVPLIFGLSIGGIYAGVFTPTEAAAVGAFLSLLFGVVTRRLGVSGIVATVGQTVRLVAPLFMLVLGGVMFGVFLARTGIPRDLAAFVAGLQIAPALVVAVIFLIYFVLGALMDEIAILVIMTPIVYPVVRALGYDGIWFGVLSIMMLLTGLLTPPVGLLSFVTSSATGISIGRVYAGVTPFWITLIFATALVILFPDIATFLPRAMR